MSKELKFKTNINCMGCVAKVKPFLDGESAIDSWHVEVDKPEKILTVKSATLNEADIKNIIAKTGFSAETTN
jgi:copper chaperone